MMIAMHPEGFTQRLMELIHEFSGGRYSRFARQIGTGPTTVDNYLKGKSLPGMEMLLVICEQCGVTPNWLFYGWSPKYGGKKRPMPESVRVIDVAGAGEIREGDLQTVPILGSAAWRERGIIAVTPESMEGFLVAAHAERARLAAMRMNDDAMSPELDVGDLVLFDMEDKEPAQLDGQLVAVWTDAGVTVRRFAGGSLIPADMRRFHVERLMKRDIVGRVVEVRKQVRSRSR